VVYARLVVSVSVKFLSTGERGMEGWKGEKLHTDDLKIGERDREKEKEKDRDRDRDRDRDDFWDLQMCNTHILSVKKFLRDFSLILF
jgi:hypothetical protein